MSEAEQWVHAEHRIKQLEAQLETKDHELVAVSAVILGLATTVEPLLKDTLK